MGIFDRFKKLIRKPEKEIKKPEERVEKPKPLKEKKEKVLVKKKPTKKLPGATIEAGREIKEEKEPLKPPAQPPAQRASRLGERASRPGGKKKTSRITFDKIDIGEAHRVIISPLISEKATDLISHGQYVFKIRNYANKAEVKKAISRLYSVTVTNVRIINIPRKRRRLGRSEGYKSGYKKAVVSLKKGDKIEILSHQ